MTKIKPLQEQIKETMSNAQALTVCTQDDLQLASDYLVQCNARIKAVKEAFDNIVCKAYETHRAATAERKRHLDPVERAKAIISGKISSYHMAQERIRAEAEAAARKKAQEDMEALKIAEAEALAAEGYKDEAEMVLDEDRPIEAVRVPEPDTPDGLHFRDNWQFDVIDKDKIPAEYLIVDEKAIRSVVKALKNRCNIPGIRVYNKKTIVQRQV